MQITWSGLSGWSNTYGCNTRTFTSDTAGSTAQCQVDKGSTSYLVKVVIHVDQTPPAVSAVASRPPDHDGWYRTPVNVTFQASDHTSGAGACTTATYAGPDTSSGVVTGTCHDIAGNVATGSFPIQYDSTPPVVKLTAATGDREVDLQWTATGASVVLLTRDGGGIFGGLGGAFADRSVRNRHRYLYTLTALDPAGNLGRASVVARPRPHLIAPRFKHRFRRPPVLSWTPVRGARYYNVQIYRHGREVLSAWPSTAHLQLRRHWRLRGKRERLHHGTYRWYVWPGRGSRAANRYGPLIGTRHFRMR